MESYKDISDGNAVTNDIHLNITNTNYTYDVNSFVAATAGDKTSSLVFLVAKVMVRNKHQNEVVVSILEYWFGAYGNTPSLHAKYAPLHHQGRTCESRCPWKDTISTDTILVNFSSVKKTYGSPVLHRSCS